MEAAFISFLINKLGGIAVDQAQSRCSQLTLLLEQIHESLMQAFLQGSNWSTDAAPEKAHEAWIGQVREVAFKIEDIIDEYLYLVGRQGESSIITWKNCLMAPSDLCWNLPDDCQIVSVEEGESQISDAIYSLSSEGEDGNELVHNANSLVHEYIYMFRETDRTYWVGKHGGWQPMVQVSQFQYECQHQWEFNDEVEAQHQRCHCCKRETMKKHRMHCSKCTITSCRMCAPYFFNQNVPVAASAPISYDPRSLLKEQKGYITWCDAEIERLKGEIEALKIIKKVDTEKEELQFENDRLKLENADLKKEIEHLKKRPVINENFEENDDLNVLIGEGRMVNRLFNLMVEIEIPDIPKFKVQAILDTGATTCCIDQGSIPTEAIEDNPYVASFSGINSKTTTANKKLKYGKLIIGEHTFRIPYTYVFPVKLGDNIQMILGYNFIRAMNGGVRIEGNEVTFYKNVTTIQRQPMAPCAVAIQELELDEEELIAIEEIISAGSIEVQSNFQDKFSKLVQDLKAAGYIRDNPMKHWSNNKITCQLSTKNPELTIEDTYKLDKGSYMPKECDNK